MTHVVWAFQSARYAQNHHLRHDWIPDKTTHSKRKLLLGNEARKKRSITVGTGGEAEVLGAESQERRSPPETDRRLKSMS